jgi:hypothetical protein
MATFRSIDPQHPAIRDGCPYQSCPPQNSSLALGALSTHQSGLEAALFQPAHDLVLGEADIRCDPHMGDQSACQSSAKEGSLA